MRRTHRSNEAEGDACAYCGIQNVPLEVDHIGPQARNPEESATQLLCRPCHEEKSLTEQQFDDGWRPFTSVLSPQTSRGFQMQVREKPFNWVHTHAEPQALRLEVCACAHVPGAAVGRVRADGLLRALRGHRGALELRGDARGEDHCGERVEWLGVVLQAEHGEDV